MISMICILQPCESTSCSFNVRAGFQGLRLSPAVSADNEHAVLIDRVLHAADGVRPLLENARLPLLRRHSVGDCNTCHPAPPPFMLGHQGKVPPKRERDF